jgi:uncharacterized membrane protein YsdA (DUF1294 family)
LAFAWIYFIAISILALILTFRDKNAARYGKWRVKERTLIWFATLGGAAALLISMLAIRHKTKRVKFMVGLPMLILLQAMLVFSFSLFIIAPTAKHWTQRCRYCLSMTGKSRSHATVSALWLFGQ